MVIIDLLRICSGSSSLRAWSMVGICLMILLPCRAQANELRTWTSDDGRTLEGQLVSADDDTVVIKLKGGRSYEMPLTRLSGADRKHIAELAAKGLTIAVGEMPEETRIDTQVEVEGGPRIFTTEHFEFHTDQDVTKAFIAEAARVYEGTYRALSELPIGLKMRPPEGMERFRGLFMNREAFEAELAKQNQDNLVPAGNAIVAGVYIPSRKELLVPYSSLGARDSGSRKTLRKSSDTSTLVHEIVHQVMHDYLPLMPLWFTEGFAEYLNIVPYQNGRFEFRNLERGLKEHLEKQYRDNYGRQVDSLSVAHPSYVMENMTKSFSQANTINTIALNSDPLFGYRSSLLLFTYLMHFDRPDAVGAPVAAYLNNYDINNFNPQQFIDEFNAAVDQFNKERDRYNAGVKVYNEALTTYRSDVTKANERIDLINEAIRAGFPEDRWPKPFPKPRPPTPPEELLVPKILEENPEGASAVFENLHAQAAKIITRDRSPDQLAENMKKAYAAIGIDLKLGSFTPKEDREEAPGIMTTRPPLAPTQEK